VWDIATHHPGREIEAEENASFRYPQLTMAEREFETFEEFWPYYVGEHRSKATRLLHFAGTTAAMGCVAGAVVFKKRWLLAVAPIAGYGPAWVSHFFIEKNKPATFTYPVWSLRADFVMWWKTVRGEMQAEVDRVIAAESAARAEAEDRADASAVPNESVN
jgi:hypothetical protein